MSVWDILGINLPFGLGNRNSQQPGTGQFGVIPFNNPKPKTVIPAPSLGSSLGAYKNYPYSTGAPYGVTPSNSAQYQGALKKIADAGSTSAQSAIPTGDQFVDPYAAFDPEKMVAREFDPQMALISQQEAQAKSSYGKGAADIGLGWDLIAKAVGAREKGIKTDTAARGAALTKGWGSVSNNSNAALDAARAEIIANAQQSGNSMESIAPLLAKLATSKATLGAETGARQQNWAGFNAQMGQNAVQENQLAQDTAKWGGINAKADFATRLQGALADLENKRLGVTGARGAALNKYGMDITNARLSARSAWDQMETARAAQAIAMKKEEDAAAAASAKASTPAPIDPSKLTPSQYLAYVAGGLYNKPNEGTGTGSRAGNAANAIMDVARQGKGWKNVTEFVNDVMAHNPNASHAGGDARQLAQLAQDYYIRIAGGANKPVGTNQMVS
jgi:hypothetical protein